MNKMRKNPVENILLHFFHILAMCSLALFSACHAPPSAPSALSPNKENLPVDLQSDSIHIDRVGAKLTLNSAATSLDFSSWRILAKPPESLSELLKENDGAISFTPDTVGSYVLARTMLRSSKEDQGSQQLLSLEVFEDQEFSGYSKHRNSKSTCSICHNLATLLPDAGHITTNGQCAACHGIRKWKPLTTFSHGYVSGGCNNCHNDGKLLNHKGTEEPCITCHVTSSWRLTRESVFLGIDYTVENIAYAHSRNDLTCEICHVNDWQNAQTKPVKHILSDDRCGNCHSVQQWTPVAILDHRYLIGVCVDCHKAPSNHFAFHIVNNCENCHASVGWETTTSISTDLKGFRQGGKRHPKLSNTCFSCHDGQSATGFSKGHKVTQQDCGLCQSTIQWAFARAEADFRLAFDCVRCHNGQLANAKNPGHLSTTDYCYNCHNTANWRFQTTRDHENITGDCISCHNNLIRTGKPDAHLATSNSCQACHFNLVWKPIRYANHAEMQGVCSKCHDNIVTRGKGAAHVETTNECDGCHTTAFWVDHRNKIGECISCHDNNISKGKPNTHIPTSDTCFACHVTEGWKKIIRVDHNALLTTTTCAVCHNISHYPTAESKSSTHILTTDNCFACHNIIAWTPYMYLGNSSKLHAEILGSCGVCHNNQYMRGKGVNHIGTNLECNSCHNTGAWTPATTGGTI